jgi:23S rRNA (pseudouridine1915-N3)-methyltransferase
MMVLKKLLEAIIFKRHKNESPAPAPYTKAAFDPKSVKTTNIPNPKMIMKVTIAAIGRDKHASPTDNLFKEYKKRIPWIIDLKEFEEKKSLPPHLLMEREAEMLLAAAPASAKIIALDENGKSMSSEEFAAQIVKWQEQGASNLVFMIGGAAGHGSSVKERADLLLSLGKMTWPHMMVRAMLSEQLYRAHTIITGHPYHKA